MKGIFSFNKGESGQAIYKQ